MIVQPAKDSDFEKKIQIIEETVLLLYTPQTSICSLGSYSKETMTPLLNFSKFYLQTKQKAQNY